MSTPLTKWGLEGKFESTKNYYCIKRETADQNPTWSDKNKYTDVEFTMACANGASYISLLVSSSALAVSAYLF